MTHVIPPFESAGDKGYKFLRVLSNNILHIDDVIVLYVEGGVSPYDWEVSDDTYLTLGAAQTTDQNNTITSAADAPIGTRETVTITDAEGSEVEIIVCVCNAPCCDGEACDGQVPFAFDDDSTPDSVEHDDCIDVYLEGGCPPFTWEITSEDDEGQYKYSFEADSTAVRENELCAGLCIDDEVSVKVTDGCATEVEFDITGVVDPSVTEVEIDDDNTPATIDPAGWIYIYASGGEGPYTWEVSGTGYSMRWDETESPLNILDAASGECGVDIDAYGTVTVTDLCGSTDTAVIRNTGGEWVEVGQAAGQSFSSCTACGDSPDTPCAGGKCRSVYGTCLGEKWTPPWLSDNQKAWDFECICRKGNIVGDPDWDNCLMTQLCRPSYYNTLSGSPEEPPCGDPLACGGFYFPCWDSMSNDCQQTLYCEDCVNNYCTVCAVYRFWYYEWGCP